jgi:rod shape-determining protein MreD
MATLIAIPILGVLVLLQSTIFSRFPLLHGTADLVLLAVIAWALQKRVQTAWQWGIIGGLFVGLVSALPFWACMVIYPLAVAVALALRQRVWQAPILAMFIATFALTLLTHLITMGALRLSGASLPLQQTLNLITLPSLLLNLLIAIPTFFLLADLAKWVYPEELEV